MVDTALRHLRFRTGRLRDAIVRFYLNPSPVGELEARRPNLVLSPSRGQPAFLA
jgi:hypothetical protein